MMMPFMEHHCIDKVVRLRYQIVIRLLFEELFTHQYPNITANNAKLTHE